MCCFNECKYLRLQCWNFHLNRMVLQYGCPSVVLLHLPIHRRPSSKAQWLNRPIDSLFIGLFLRLSVCTRGMVIYESRSSSSMGKAREREGEGGGFPFHIVRRVLEAIRIPWATTNKPPTLTIVMISHRQFRAPTTFPCIHFNSIP